MRSSLCLLGKLSKMELNFGSMVLAANFLTIIGTNQGNKKKI
jgi:hypothetical protein